MSYKANEYLEVFDPTKKEFFPVRIVETTLDGIICYFLNLKREKKIYKFSLETYGYMKPSITDELIINCGFEQNNIQFVKENKIVIKCIVGDLKESVFPYYADFSYNVFGYKFIHSEEELTEIIKILQTTKVDKSSLEFSEENESTFRIEKLRDYCNIDNDIFDNLYLKSRSIK